MVKKLENKEELLYKDEKLTTTTHKCKSCGGEMFFSPKEQKLQCEYCGSLEEVDFDSIVSEKNIEELIETAVVDKDVDVYQCKSCGAKEIISKQDIAVTCPFCGTNNIVKMGELSGIKPQGIVPFKIERSQVLEIAKNWSKKRKMAPNDFSTIASAEKINGIYNPLFTFDSKTFSSYEGRLGKRYTVTRGSGKDRHTETEIRYFHISGKHTEIFDDLLIEASNKIPQFRLKEIEPFSTNEAITYDSKFLRGYTASSNTREGKQCWEDAKNEMKEVIEDNILKGYNYDVISYLNVKTQYFESTYKYVLVPLYVGYHKYKNKTYNFYINGVNGKISGDSPVSFWKVFFLVLFIILVAGIVSWLIITD